MFGNFIFSFNAVAPMFMLICLGYWLKRKGFITQGGKEQIISIVFNIAIPLMIIRDISSQDISGAIDLAMVAFNLAAVTAGFVIAWIAAVIATKDRAAKGSFVQGAFRGNYAIMGLGLVANVTGQTSTPAVVMLIFMVAIYNTLSVFILTYYCADGMGAKSLPKAITTSMLKNPLIISMLVAVAISLARLPIPYIISIPMNHLAQTGLPLALLSLGASIEISGFKESLGLTSLATFIKLVLIPLVACSIAIVMGQNGEQLLIVLVATGSPAAVGSYVMARQMGTDAPLAANIVVLSTLFSMFSFTLFLFAFVTLGYI